MDQNYFRNLISGKEIGVKASLIRSALRPFSLCYSVIIWLRNIGYNFKILRSYKVAAPVISIGNITAGGTGKTPIVMWLCKLLENREIKAAVISRGYKSQAGSLGDEAAMMIKNCPQTKVIINSNRVCGAQKAIEEYDCKMIVLDDAFQHRRLRRDLDIVAVDATCPFGFGKMLPSGLLREMPSNLKRAHAAIITRTDQCDENAIEKIEEIISAQNPDILIARSIHKLVSAKMMKDVTIELSDLLERKVFAFCGIGNPESFCNGLKKTGLDIVGSKFFNDHEDYTKESLRNVATLAKESGADILLTTQKDWVKIALLAREVSQIEFAYIAIELEITSNKEKLTKLIDKFI